jgi:hypothetical protein
VENRGGDPRARQVAIIRLLAEAPILEKRASFLTTESLKAGFSDPARWQHVRPRMPMQATGQSRTRELVEKLKEKDTAYAGLEKSKQAATERAEEVEALVGTLEVEIRARDDYAARRDRELELAYSSINRMAAAMGGATKAKPADTKTEPAETAKEKAAPPATAMPASPPITNIQPVEPRELVNLVVAVMKKAEGNPLSTAEIHAQLPESENIQQRQVYNLLYRHAAAGATFVFAGEGKFTLRDPGVTGGGGEQTIR